MEKMNLFQRMAGITAELGTVAKNLNVQTGKGKSYKAVSERDIIDAVKPLEAKYGVYSYPSEREVVESQILESDDLRRYHRAGDQRGCTADGRKIDRSVSDNGFLHLCRTGSFPDHPSLSKI